MSKECKEEICIALFDELSKWSWDYVSYLLTILLFLPGDKIVTIR